MIRRLLALLRQSNQPDPRTLIARRAVRVSNRKAEATKRYEAVHVILARGPKQ